jgi:thiol-disulfide isomerase/thioredoxin
MFFYADWCPWSKKARPQWDAFRDDLKRQPVTFGGNHVVFEEIDGDVEVEKRKQYGVSAYPAFKLVLPTETRDMTTIPTRDGMRDFLLRNLGREEPIQLLPRAV